MPKFESCFHTSQILVLRPLLKWAADAEYMPETFRWYKILGFCPYSSFHRLRAVIKRRQFSFSFKKKIYISCLLYQRLRACWLVRDRLCSASLISWLASSWDGATEVCPIKLSPVLKGPAVLGQRPRLWPKIEETSLALFQALQLIYSVWAYPEESTALQGGPARHLYMCNWLCVSV